MNVKTITLAVSIGWSVLAGFAAAEPPENSRPNIILMMADDLGWGDPQCFDPASPIKTPHLDAMASTGLKFNRFYAAAPVCSPTRGSCLTGRHPFRYGIYQANHGYMKPEELTLAELLQELGYATGHFGKWHLGTMTKSIKDANRGGPQHAELFSPPQDNGFEVCFSTESKVPTWDPMLKPRKGASGQGWHVITDHSDAVEYGTHYWNERGQIVRDNLEGDDARVIMDRAVPFIIDALDVELADDRPSDGISLLPVLTGEQTVREQPIGFQSQRQLAWTTQQYKLYSADAGKTWELYDLQADPSETNNLATGSPEIVQQMSQQLAAWRESCEHSDQRGDY